MSRSTLLMPLSMLLMTGGIAGFVFDSSGAMFRFASWLLALVVIGITAWSISDRPGRDPLDVRILDAAIIALSFMALSVLALGSLGLLGWWMLVITTAMAGSTWDFIDRRVAFERLPGGEQRIRAGFVSALAIGLGTFAAVQAVLGRVFRPPVGDALAYHLPFAVEWLQRGNLNMPIPAAGDPSPPFYPLNSSAWTYWLLAPFESEILARFVQLPFLLLLALAVFRICLELRLSRPAAAMAAALSISVPSIARSASLPENDLILAALLIVATAYILRLARDFTVWRAGLAATVIGLAVGTKVIALGFGALLGVVWVVLVIRARRADGVGSVVRVLSAGAVIVLLLGGYSYLRNTLMMGNPLYPAGYDLPGGFTLEGLYYPTWEWRQEHAFFPFDWRAFLNGSRHDFGWTITAWAIPGVLLAGLLSVAGLVRRSSQAALGLIPVVWVGISLAIFWYVIPYHFSRFLFPTIVMAVVAGMWALGRIAGIVRAGRVEAWYPLLAAPVIATNLINIPLDPAVRERPVYWLAAATVIGGGTVALLLAGRMPAHSLRLVVQGGAMAAMVLAMIAWPFYLDEYDERRLAEWRAQIQGFSQSPDAWEWLEDETAGVPSVIAVAGTNEIFPLYGPELDNRVVTIWHSGELADYGWFDVFVFYGEPHEAAWLDQIDGSDVDFVLITEDVSFGGWPVERTWMQATPERFELAFATAELEIWRVAESGTQAARYTGRQGRFIQSDWHVH